MLSVLIPIYNHDVNNLVTTLDQQLTQSGIPYEIILADDCSDNLDYRKRNENLSRLASVQYIQNQSNMGRAKIRNRLADAAQYPYLLFIDCDATVQHQDYIKKNLKAIEKMQKEPLFVINGGIAYQAEKPDSKYFLRWYYGKKREEESADKRASQSYHHFTPFNVVITKSLFQCINFDESLTSYGHEDTLFGCQLKEQEIPYLHIDNHLIHNGLDTNEEFLKKIRVSIGNLTKLSEDQNINKHLLEDNKLLKAYRSCSIIGLPFFLKLIFKKYQTRIEQQLCEKPSMFLLDLYKLCYLATIK
ncbi:MAG: glycosyltransferase family 2 protein [Bacteroidales bacterium]|nr:glycosyltransferase family 2 protein [Bacteroidales bacterium]